MEYILAFLFTSQYILGRDRNADIFYLFSALALFFYVLKRREKFYLILKCVMPFAVVTLIMAFLYPWSDTLRTFIFLAKMVLNITLLVFVAYNSKRWNIYRFAEMIALIQGIETVIALLLPDSALWYQDEFIQGTLYASRLRLFYTDAGTLAFSSGIVLVMLIYQMMTQEVFWKQALCSLVMMVDMYLSYSIGAMGYAAVAILIMAVVGYYSKRNSESGRKQRIILRTFAFVIAAVGMIVVTNPIFYKRVIAMINGEDIMVYYKLTLPLTMLTNVLKKTYFLGTGFGNGNTAFAVELVEGFGAFPNSFMRIISEGGIFGILLVFSIILGIGFLCIKYGKSLDKALFAYIIMYQMTGGYFTDSKNFFIYGWIIGDCFYNMVMKTGSCPVKMFVSVNKDKLKIAMIGHKHIPGREGGVEVVVEELSKRLVKMGHQVDAYNRSGQHISGAENSGVDYKTLNRYEGIGIISVPTINRKGFAALIYSFIASIMVSFKDYDVIHYHAEGPCAFMWIPSVFGIRTVCTIHGLDWARTGKWGSLASSFIKFGERVAVGVSDAMIVLSRHLQQYFKDNYNRDSFLIYNGIERPEIVNADVIGSKWGLNRDDYILSLSRLTREKRIDLLIEAFKEVETDKKLVIAGGSSDSTEYVDSLKRLAEGDDRIVFTGFVKGRELSELYSNAYVYCLPSEIEGMPISLLEAMSYGNCCLTSDIPENYDVVSDKGVTFRVNDKAELVKALKTLIENPEMVARYKNSASDYVCNRYNWDEIAAMTVQLYK
ncbi:glycosyltransferase [Butyrivibrio sp. FCS014]|uniref:glycosyltransferase n=1 Tax=Butyrivibrio sp. FCS014 TaxID=1408304 RepID=UPI0004B3D560|nr:glycosyltransferase [Butyrivibrio sp. FCS014]